MRAGADFAFRPLQARHANYSSGKWKNAAGHYQRLLRFTPQHVFARWGFADALIREGKLQKAVAVLNEGISMAGADPHPLLVTSLSRTRELTEPRARRPRASHEIEQQTNDPVLLAEVYISAGEMTKAFRHLNEAAELRHYRLSAVNMFPQFESLRQDSRYDRLLKRMGLCG